MTEIASLMNQVMSLPVASAGRYELCEDEVRLLRSRIYSLNANNAAGYRYRTSKLPIRNPKPTKPPKKNYADTSRYLLLVWRLS